MIKEIIFIQPAIFEAKHSLGHAAYEVEMNIDIALGKAKLENMPKGFTEALKKIKEDLIKITNEFYDHAYKLDSGESTSVATFNEPASINRDIKDTKDSSLKDLAKFSAREIKSLLKEIREPIFAYLSASSKEIPISEAMDSIIERVFSSIFEPLKNIVKDYDDPDYRIFGKSFRFKIIK